MLRGRQALAFEQPALGHVHPRKGHLLNDVEGPVVQRPRHLPVLEVHHRARQLKAGAHQRPLLLDLQGRGL